MTYLPTMGTIDTGSFNDTRFPGVAYATNPATHAIFLDLQNQLNRSAVARTMPTRIAVDGKIGSETQSLAKAIGFVNIDSIHDVATKADSLAAGAKAIADSAGVSKTVAGPKPSAPPAIFDPSTNTLKAAPATGASLATMFSGMSTTTMLLLGGLVVGAGFYLTMDSKKRKGRR